MVTISLCMIVKNEEAVLGRCLDSAAGVADEIIIVDTGSTDRTKEIAQEYTDKVYDFPWINDFSAARNHAYSLAAMDYQLWLDADDVLPEDEREKFLVLKERLSPATDMVTMKYHTHFSAEGKPLLTSTRERLTRRERGFRWQDPIHECIPLSGNIVHSEIAIWHQKPHSKEASTRNLEVYEALAAGGNPLSPRQEYYFARELKDHGQYAKAAYYFERFLAGGRGWMEDNIASCFNLSICYHALGDEGRILPVLLRSFEFDRPRGELCCEIGYYHQRRGVHQTALHWFQVAAKLEAPNSLGFILPDYWGFIPCIESCVCCCHLGDYEQAKVYNQEAGLRKPNHPAVLQNEVFLSSIMQ